MLEQRHPRNTTHATKCEFHRLFAQNTGCNVRTPRPRITCNRKWFWGIEEGSGVDQISCDKARIQFGRSWLWTKCPCVEMFVSTWLVSINNAWSRLFSMPYAWSHISRTSWGGWEVFLRIPASNTSQSYNLYTFDAVSDGESVYPLDSGAEHIRYLHGDICSTWSVRSPNDSSVIPSTWQTLI